MPTSSRRTTSRPHTSHNISNSIREYNRRTSLANHSHIQTRPAESIPDNSGSKDENESRDYIIKESAQEEIQDQLEYETRLEFLRRDYTTGPNSTELPRNLTFAEATMAARTSRSRRRNEAFDAGPDMVLGGPMTLESLGPFKYTFKKKKNLKTKYSASTLDGDGTGSDHGGVSLNGRVGTDTNTGITTSTNTSRGTSRGNSLDMGHMSHMGPSEITSEVRTDLNMVRGQVEVEVEAEGDGEGEEQEHEHEVEGEGEGEGEGEDAGSSSSRPISSTSTPQFNSSLDFLHSKTTTTTIKPSSSTSQKQQTSSTSNFTLSAPAPKRLSQILQQDCENINYSRTPGERDLGDENGKELNNNSATQLSFTNIAPAASGGSSINPFPSRIIPPLGLSRFSSVSHSSTENTRAQTLNTIDSGIDLDNSSLDFLKCDDSDTQSVKDKSDAVMARIVGSTGLMMKNMSDLTTINDGFDSVEWDPDLPVRSMNDSPEPLSVEAQPVAYTTVGSRVNPNIQPQISAPNRIQREGSIRRPQLDPTHSRQSGYFQHARGPPPPLSMQNSMHYAQQLGQASNTFNTPPATSARSCRSTRPSQKLSQPEQENQTLLRLQGMINARAPSGQYPVSPSTPTPASHQIHFPSISNEDQEMVRGNDLQGPISGLEKMQTLQRLARFPNPMQTSALRRLSELQAPKSDTAASINTESSGQRLEYLLRTSKDQSLVDDVQATKNGELDRGYTFPPPGISSASYNPLFGAYGGSSSHSRDSANHRGIPGYPQPLTAGPPGQRSYANNKHNNNYSEELWTQDQTSAKQNSHASSGPMSPWQEPKALNEQYSAQAPAPAPSARATDTIPMQEALQYYPHGFPGDMNGRYTRLSVEVQREMGLLTDEETADQARERKQNENDEWFYGGQKRWNMTTEDHIKEIELHANPFGAIGPPKKVLPSDNRPLPGITLSEMQQKTIPEVIAPMLDGTFGNMFAIEAQQKETNPTQPFNRYIKSPEWHIDSSAKGNDSFFGEDWGVPLNVPTIQTARIQRY